MSRSVSMRQAAAKIEQGHFTTGHPAYRQHLEVVRTLLCDVALLVTEDSERSAAWHRARGLRTGRGNWEWVQRFFLSRRMRSHGRDLAEAVMEGAKDAVLMSMVHQEYMALEASKQAGAASVTIGGSGRYRTEVT